MFHFILSLLFLTTFLALSGCEEKKQPKKPTHSKISKISKILIQNPGLQDIMQGPTTATFLKKHIVVISNEESVTVKKLNKDKIGWSLWIFSNLPANKTYTIKMKIKKGMDKKLLSQVQIKFMVKNKPKNRYFYVFKTNTGLVIPQQKAKKSMVSVISQGSHWLLTLKAKSPATKSAMQFMLLPVVGAKIAGQLEIESIQIF